MKENMRVSRPFLVTVLTVLVLSAVSPAPMLAQKSSGEILGTVTDSTGAVVPKASITLTNIKTKETRRSTADEMGNFRFLFVLPGAYSLRAEATGFQPVIEDELILRVGEKRRQDVTLQLGAVTEAVEVTASPIAFNAESPSLGNVIEERRILELPLNGRSFLSLAYLSAGAIQPGVGNVGSVAVGLSGGRPGVAVSVSGMREGSNEILLDGIPSKHNFCSAVGVQPVLDGKLPSSRSSTGTSVRNTDCPLSQTWSPNREQTPSTARSGSFSGTTNLTPATPSLLVGASTSKISSVAPLEGRS